MRLLIIGGIGPLPPRSPAINLHLALVAFCALTLLCSQGRTRAAPAPPPLPPLTTASGNPRLPGKFVWADLVTDDVAAAGKFYHDLFGWTFRTVGDYTIAVNHDRPLCGLFQRPRPTEQSVHPRWFGYLSVSSVSRAERKTAKLGGRVLAPARSLPKRGEQAVFADPEGAVFGVIKSSSGDPEDFQADVGDWIWIQLLSRDGHKAAEFYREVGGYDIVENTQSNRLSDFVLVSEGYARATVRTIPASRTEVQPVWLPFVRVSSVTESVERARQLGGQVLLEPKPEYLAGKVAVVSDPTGAAIGLLEWSDDLLKGGR